MAAKKRAKGQRRSQPERNRPLATFSLSREALEALERLSERMGVSKSAVVEMAVRAAARREGVSLGTSKR